VRVAIISDIHSNLEAFETVLADIDRNKPDKIICLGDIVGYGADPNQCCDLAKRYCDAVVIGNHDAAVVEAVSLDYFVDHAEEAILWTRKVLRDDNFQWLFNLPYTLEEEDFIFCHGAPHKPKEFIYVIDYSTATYSLKHVQMTRKRCCFVGHAHITHIFWSLEDGSVGVYAPEYFNFNDCFLAVANVGSIGQPRDGNPKCAWSILDTNTFEYEVFRLEYDIQKASSKIIEAGLPEILARRLFVGR
jgi:diadenosine tetraphosphatase ApaH/serine/threonine PP2A family protein phosphatase